jgi:ribosome assembly protein 1
MFSRLIFSNDISDESENENILIGLARIYSGTVKVGQEVYVYGPKYDPAYPDLHISRAKIERLFLIMGKGLEDLSEVPAGNIFGILGIQKYVFKTATLSSSLNCPIISRFFFSFYFSSKGQANAILRVAVEPVDPQNMNKLLEGLKMLDQADGCVLIDLQDTGENIIACAGELHLEVTFLFIFRDV